VTEANSSNANTFNYTVNTAGLTPGKYTTSMQVEMWKGANSSYGHVQGSPYTFPITLTITPKPTAPPMPTTVRDPSFDLWSNGWLGIGRGFDHWDAWSSGALSPTQEYRSTVARTGAYAAGLSNTRSDPTYIEEIYQEVGVTPGYSYTLGAYSMTNRNPACVQLRLAFSNAANKSLVTLSTAGNQWGLGAGAWSRLRVTGVAPPGATHAVLDMRLTGGTYGGSSSGWALWDDVSWDRSAVPVTSGAGATATSISRPTLSTPRPKRGKYVTSSAVLTPGAAASGTSTKLLLYRQETKTVRKRVRGKMRKVKVKYWRLRSTIPMTPGAVGASTGFTAKYKLKYAGKWQAIASFGGGGGYAETKSSAKSFTAR
jgi:hypothetical protein